MNAKPILITVVACIAVAVCFCLGHHLSVESNRNVDNHDTFNSLIDWAAAVTLLIARGDDNIRVFESAQEIREYVVRNGFIENSQCPGLLKDAWGNDYHLVRANIKGVEAIRLISCGRNGICEAGGGDDLYVEIQPVIQQNRAVVRVKFRKINENGRAEYYYPDNN